MPSLTTDTASSGKSWGRNGGVVSASSRNSANRYRSEDIRPSSDTLMPVYLPLSGLRRDVRRRLLRQTLLQPVDIFEQAGGYELQEIEAEGRVLHIKLLDLVVAHGEDQPVGDALHRLSSHVRWCQHAELADDGADRKLDAGLDQPIAAADDIIHAVGLLVLVEQNLAGLAWALGHERL